MGKARHITPAAANMRGHKVKGIRRLGKLAVRDSGLKGGDPAVLIKELLRLISQHISLCIPLPDRALNRHLLIRRLLLI